MTFDSFYEARNICPKVIALRGDDNRETNTVKQILKSFDEHIIRPRRGAAIYLEHEERIHKERRVRNSRCVMRINSPKKRNISPEDAYRIAPIVFCGW